MREKPRIVIAMMKHETNTFSPVVTDWARFEEWGAWFGAAALKAYEGTGMPMAAYIALARERGATIITPVAAEAMPSGVVTEDAYRKITDAICDAVADGADAVMLDLHGATVSELGDDGEGMLLERIRAIDPDVPICVTCDLHANLTASMVENCNALIGYKTYPHVDMFEVGDQIGRVLFDSIDGKSVPVMAWGNIPLLAQTLCMGTADQPMKTLIAMAREAETRPGILAVTVFGGFPMADIRDAGLSVIVVSDDDRNAAQAVVDDLLQTAWSRREAFIYEPKPLAEAMSEAASLDDGPVLLLDHADNVGSGGTQDVMTVIRAVLEAGLENVAVACVCDPEAVGEMASAGPGARLTISLGGKTDMPSVGLKGEPLEITGIVRRVTDGNWIVRGPMYTGVEVSMGRTVLFDTGNMEIVVVSHHHEPWDVGVFTSVGIDPGGKNYLVLKSRIHYRAGFGDLGTHTLTCDGEGVTTSDNSLLNFEKVRRPIYPLDLINEP